MTVTIGRRELLVALGGAAAWPFAARARSRPSGCGAAESEEKREPVSDIDTGVVDSLKALDPDGRNVRFVPQLMCHN